MKLTHHCYDSLDWIFINETVASKVVRPLPDCNQGAFHAHFPSDSQFLNVFSQLCLAGASMISILLEEDQKRAREREKKVDFISAVIISIR